MKYLIGLDLGGTKCEVLFGELSDSGDISVVEKVVYTQLTLLHLTK